MNLSEHIAQVEELVKQGDYVRALERYRPLLAANENQHRLWYGVGYCYYKLRDTSQARAALEKALSLGNPGASKLLQRVAQVVETTQGEAPPTTFTQEPGRTPSTSPQAAPDDGTKVPFGRKERRSKWPCGVAAAGVVCALLLLAVVLSLRRASLARDAATSARNRGQSARRPVSAGLNEQGDGLDAFLRTLPDAIAMGDRMVAEAAQGNAAGVKKLLAAGADMNHKCQILSTSGGIYITPYKGLCASAVAVIEGRTNVLEVLLDAGLDPHAEVSGVTLLQLAAKHGQPEVAGFLIEAGVEPTDRRQGTLSPLRLAAEENHAGVLEVLLNSGAPLESGPDLLDHAIHYNQPEIVDVLLAAGVDPNQPSSTRGHASLLETAAAMGRFVEPLLAAGARVDNLSGDRGTVGRYNSLHRAAFNGDLATVRLLVDAGADVNAPGVMGATPADRARYARDTFGNRGDKYDQVIAFLQEHGAR